MRCTGSSTQLDLVNLIGQMAAEPQVDAAPVNEDDDDDDDDDDDKSLSSQSVCIH